MIWEQQVSNCCTLHLQGERRESHPGKEERGRVRMKLFTGAGSWDVELLPTHRLLETLVVRAVTEARDTESGSSPSPSLMARRSRSSISSTAGSSGEEERLIRWAGP